MGDFAAGNDTDEVFLYRSGPAPDEVVRFGAAGPVGSDPYQVLGGARPVVGDPFTSYTTGCEGSRNDAEDWSDIVWYRPGARTPAWEFRTGEEPIERAAAPRPTPPRTTADDPWVAVVTHRVSASPRCYAGGAGWLWAYPQDDEFAQWYHPRSGSVVDWDGTERWVPAGAVPLVGEVRDEPLPDALPGVHTQQASPWYVPGPGHDRA